MTPERISHLQQLAWTHSDLRHQVQQHGVNVIPCNFYSSIPSVAEIKQSFEYKEPAPFLDATLFDTQRLHAELLELMPFAGEFSPPLEGDPDQCREFFWNNTQFSYSDAMSYYCFIRQRRPRTVLEIGSGYSTLIAMEALRRNGTGRLVCIEPYPRPFLNARRDIELIQRPAQSVTADEVNGLLADGDMLFIDSTHTVKAGSDCLHIYLRLIPNLAHNVTVHVHDIFLPFGMPQEWLLEKNIYWTEQYLLYAFLLDNAKARVLYGSAYHQVYNPKELSTFMAGKCGAGGSSLWFAYNGHG